MTSTQPLQERVVDPFASTNSDVVNRLNELVTHNDVGMLTASCLEVISDSTSPDTTVTVTPGYVVKDDVLIKITQDHSVDFTVNDNWVTAPTMSFAGGYCYVVLKYTYRKQRPAPIAEIKILQPDQRTFLDTDTSFLLLKVVELSASSPHNIINMYDYDPSTGYTQNERPYIKYYAGVKVNLDIHDGDEDRGRIVYETERNKFYFGYNSDWSELTPGGVYVNIDTLDSTSPLTVGDLCYVDENRKAVQSISDTPDHGADLVVQSIGTAVSGTGKGAVSGFIDQVPVEPGTIVYTGDLLYLSATTAGSVTNIRPTIGYYQIVGRALSQGTYASPIEMIFAPKAMIILSRAGQVSTWGVDSSGFYYHDIDVSDLDATGVFDCSWFDDNTKREVRPEYVEILNNGGLIRVAFVSNNLVINYMIQSATSSGSTGGGGGGGGGGGVTDHSVLANLPYDLSGHTGFSAGAASIAGGHNNSDHLQTYITDAGVTFEVLDANSDVGTGANQVSYGDHTHSQYIDVPTGRDVLFVEDTTVTGYTLQQDVDDAVIYMTAGDAEGGGGEPGGSLKSGGTWTQPVHNHTINAQASHAHTTGSLALTIAQMPQHRHTYQTGWQNGVTIIGSNGAFGGGTPDDTSYIYNTSYQGSSSAHNHGSTSSTGGHDHGGSSQNANTPNTWRPRGINVTRQRRN